MNSFLIIEALDITKSLFSQLESKTPDGEGKSLGRGTSHKDGEEEESDNEEGSGRTEDTVTKSSAISGAKRKCAAEKNVKSPLLCKMILGRIGGEGGGDIRVLYVENKKRRNLPGRNSIIKFAENKEQQVIRLEDLIVEREVPYEMNVEMVRALFEAL